MKKRTIIFLIHCILTTAIIPQDKLESGYHFIKYYSPNDYGADSQNWAIAQDKRGIIYIGNSHGVLEFDGVSWRLLEFGSFSIVRSLALANDGKLYVGGKSEFGYFARVHEQVKNRKTKNPLKRQFVSLLKHLQPEDREFTDVWNCVISSKGVFFRTNNRLFRYTPSPHLARTLPDISSIARKNEITTAVEEKSSREGSMHVWKSDNGFGGLAVVNDRIYITQYGSGLMEVKGDSLVLAPGGENVEGGIDFMVPFTDGNEREKTLISISRGKYLFRYDGVDCRQMVSEGVSYLKNLQINGGKILNDGTIAIATYKGVVIFDPRGNGSIRQMIDRSSGLKEDTVFDLFCDRQGGLWLALTNGIARVEVPSPITFFDETNGLRGSVFAVTRFQGSLYAGTETGMFYLLPFLGISQESASAVSRSEGHPLPEFSGYRHPKFKQVSGMNHFNRIFLIVHETGELLAGNEEGLFRIKGDKAEFLMTFGHSIISMYQSNQNSNLVFVGLRYGGLAAVRYVPGVNGGGSWINEGKIPGMKDTYIRNIAEGEDNSLWLTVKYSDNLIRVVFPTSDVSPEKLDLQNPKITYFGEKQGLPGNTIDAIIIDGNLYAYPDHGIFRFDARREVFSPDSTFHVATDTSTYIEKIVEDKLGNVWYYYDQLLHCASRREDGSYDTELIPFLRPDRQESYEIYPEENGVVWYGGDDALFRYDSRIKKNYEVNFPALIRRVIADGDSVIYEGLPVANAEVEPSLPFAHNTLRFEFAVPSYDNPSANQYQYFLEGFDKGWSQWTKETKKDYTNLPHGSHRFHVRAKNIYEHLSSEGIYTFSILPPWYRTLTAYIFYLILLSGAIFLVDRFQRKRLLAKAKEKMKFQEAEHRAETAELQASAAEAQAELIQIENERKTRELEEARQLQISMLPKELPKVENLDIAVYMKTATEVGGDYYDFSMKKDGSLNICLGDATGHGMKAGTLVSMMKSLFTAESIKLNIGDFFNSANDALKKMSLNKMMMAFLMINIRGNSIYIANAGIPPVYIYKKSKDEIEEVNVNGLPLGAMKNAKYEIYESELSSGDAIIMLSDGFPELQNEKDEMYGYERVISSFLKTAIKSSEEIINYLKNEGSSWVKDKVPEDDVTFVVIKVK